MFENFFISKKIYDSDKFLNLTCTAQLLYTHLAIRADNSGFVNSIKRLLLITRCQKVDLEILIDAGYIMPFKDGVRILIN
jgi:hypothetical protein